MKKWNFHREYSRGDRQQGDPAKAGRPLSSFQLLCRVCFFQSFPFRSEHPPVKIRLSQFNSDLILLKPSRNAKALPYSHWGGTDHEGLGTRTRDGVRAPQFFGNTSKPLDLAKSPSVVPANDIPAQDFHSKITCHEGLIESSLVVRRWSLAKTQ